MLFKTMRSKLILSVAMLLFSLSLFAYTTYAWFTYMSVDDYTSEVGFVAVDLDAYFDDGLGNQISASEVSVGPGVTKTGIYTINIVNGASDEFFENFRLNVDVTSNVDTYIRVKIYEQLTLTYTNYEGVVTELSILKNEYMPFNYSTTNWYDNRDYDYYIYYTIPVQRVDDVTPEVLGLITEYFSGQNFSTYSPGYSLQIAFSVEAVQAEGGPENVWNLSTPPWGGSW